MSDISQLVEGKLSPEDFISKEWGAAIHLINNLPSDLQPVAQAALTDAKQTIVDAAQWGGTAISAYIMANSQNLQTEVVGLINGVMGGASPTSASAQDTVQAVTKLLTGLVTHIIMSYLGSLSTPVPSGVTLTHGE